MSFYSSVSGVVKLVDEKHIEEFMKDAIDFFDNVDIDRNDGVLINGYSNHLYDETDDLLHKWNDRIQECEVYGVGEDDSHWRWRKLLHWDTVREEEGVLVYEGDDEFGGGII